MESNRVRKARKTEEVFRFVNRDSSHVTCVVSPSRQTEGFIESLFQMMKVRLPVLDYTTRFRRSKTLKPFLGSKDEKNHQKFVEDKNFMDRK